MRVPYSLPDINELIQKIAKEDPKRFLDLQKIKPVDYKGRYLHWDKLKYMEPPQGFTSEEYWLGTKFARAPLLKDLPLLDKEGQSFKFGAPDEVQRRLHEIDKNASGQIKMAEPVTNKRTRNRYLIKSLIEESINSSQLEGASTTRKVASEMLMTQRKPRNRSEQMILNNYHAMEFVREHKNFPLSPAMILELHRLVTLDTLEKPDLPGRFRTANDDIVIVDSASEKILHTPPPASELPERLQRLCQFANETESEIFIHPVIKSILLHFMLAYDHPFVDGNGRTARALFYWSMANQYYWLVEFISISGIIKNAPAKYGYAFLYSETDDNDATYFIIHQLGVILRAIKDLHNYLARKMDETKQALDLLSQTKLEGKLNHRQIALLEHALNHPNALYRIREHQNLHRITYQTARSDFMKLSDELGLLHKLKDGRTFVYLSPGNLKERIENL